jgi:4-amino-4-deoxy-L-arabinose transferase-like glycosyltransferase
MPEPIDSSSENKGKLSIPMPLIALAGALLTGLILRLWGIQWGFPRVDLSPDELNVWNISAGLRWHDLDTHFYNYSGLTFYLNFFGAQAARLFGVTLQPQTILLVNRLWSVFFGTLTIGLAYLTARDFFENARAGAWAAWFVSLLPIHIWHSHFGTSDIGLVFWVTTAFWLAVRAYRKPIPGRFLLGGLAVGIAIGVKFNGLLAAISFPVAAWAAWREGRIERLPRVLLLLAAAGLAALLGFFIVSPFSLLHLKDTVAAFFFESAHVKSGHYGFDLSPSGWPYFPYVYQLFAAFPFSFGLPLWLLAAIALVAFSLVFPRPRVLLGFSFVALYFAVIASWKLVPTRYYLPVQPILLILAAGMVARLLAAYASRTVWKIPLLLAVLLVLGYTLAYDVSTVDRFRRDTRLEAANWAEKEIPEQSRIVLVEPIFDRGFIVPEGDPGPMPFEVPLPRIMEKSYMPLLDRGRFQVATKDLVRTLADVENGRLGRGDILCLSSLVFLRDFRLKDKALDRQRLWNFIRRNPRKFRRLRVFDAPFLNRDFYAALDPMYACDFVSPTIEFYAPLNRRKP